MQGLTLPLSSQRTRGVRFIIESLASYVVSDGCRFEMAAMSAQGSNPEFSFLFDLRSPAHAYYR